MTQINIAAGFTSMDYNVIPWTTKSEFTLWITVHFPTPMIYKMSKMDLNSDITIHVS